MPNPIVQRLRDAQRIRAGSRGADGRSWHRPTRAWRVETTRPSSPDERTGTVHTRNRSLPPGRELTDSRETHSPSRETP